MNEMLRQVSVIPTHSYHPADLQAMVVSQHLAVVRICEEVSRGLSRLGW